MDNHSARFIVDSRGKKTAVLIPIREYEKLMEDLHDLSVVAERKDEKPVSLAEMKKRLTINGSI